MTFKLMMMYINYKVLLGQLLWSNDSLCLYYYLWLHTYSSREYTINLFTKAIVMNLLIICINSCWWSLYCPKSFAIVMIKDKTPFKTEMGNSPLPFAES